MANIYSLPQQSISAMDENNLRDFIRTRRALRRELPPAKPKKAKKASKKNPKMNQETFLKDVNSLSPEMAEAMLKKLTERAKK
jgi:hypothetical protein